MKTLSLFLSSLLMTQGASAQTIIYLAQPDQQKAFKIYAQQTNNISYEDYSIKQLSYDLPTQNLLDFFERGQKHFFSFRKGSAQEFYLQAIQLRDSGLWPKDYANIISMSYFRLAELSDEHPRKIYWLKQQIQFDPNFLTPLNLVDKKIISLWEHLKANESFTKIKLNDLQKAYSKAVINNQVYEINELDKHQFLSDIPIHITFVSSHLKQKSTSGLAHQIYANSITFDPLVTGKCQSFNIQSSLNKTQAQQEVFFNPLCIANVIDPKQQPDQGGLTLTPINKTNSALTLDSPFPEGVTASPQTPNHSLKTKWFWIGVSLVGGYLIYQHQQTSDPEKRPKRTYGYQ